MIGSAESSALGFQGFVARLLPNGTPDLGFGRGGVRLLPVNLTIAIPDGAGMVVGTVDPAINRVVIRLRPDGAPDRTFDGGSLDTRQFGESPELLGADSETRLLILDGEFECGRTFCEPPKFRIFRLLGGVSRARCLSRRATIVGTRNGDVLVGTPHRDVIAGLGGADTIEGKGGDDLICGGRGSDMLLGGPGRDRLLR